MENSDEAKDESGLQSELRNYLKQVKKSMDTMEKLQELIDRYGLPIDSQWTDYHILNYVLMKGHLTLAKVLIENGCRVNLPTIDFQCTPLHHAMNSHSIEIVELLLRKGAIIEAYNSIGETPLHLAAKLKNTLYTDLLLSLLTTIKDVNSRDASGLTFLHIACMRNNTNMIEQLLSKNVVINTHINFGSKDFPGYTPLHFAVEFEKINAAQLLLENNANINAKAKFDLTPLHVAVKKAYVPMVEMLLKENSNFKIDINAQISSDSPTCPGYAPMHFVVEFNRTSTLRLLLSYKANINIKTKRGLTPLHIAVQKGRISIIETLLEHDADVNCTDFENGSTPLHIATTNKQSRIISMLLRKGASVNSQQSNGSTCLHIATFRTLNKINSPSGMYTVFSFPFVFLHQDNFENDAETSFMQKNVEILDLIFAADDLTNTNPKNHDGISHFHIACMRDKMIVEKFLKTGIDINEAVHNNSESWPGYTALHFAVEFDKFEIVELLLNHGASVRVINRKKLTPLDIANNKTGEKENLIDIILSALSKEISDSFNTNGLANFHIACMRQSSYWSGDQLKELLSLENKINQAVSMKSKAWPGFTALHFAVLFQRIETVKILIDQGADVNLRDAKGLTPLHIACHHRNSDIVKILVENDADTNCVASKESEHIGRTPLHMACYLISPCWTVVKLLLDHGADINIQDAENDTPFSCFYNIPCQNLNISNILNVLFIYCIFWKHLNKLKIINFPISDLTEQYHKKLEKWCKSDLTTMLDEASFIKSCNSEVEQMKSTRIDKYSTLYNILYKDSNEMAVHVKNETFQKILDSKDFEENHANYGYLLKLQFKKGTSRGRLLKPAQESLEFITGFPLPDFCSERIFKYLKDDDLVNLIEAKIIIILDNEQLLDEPSKKRLRTD